MKLNKSARLIPGRGTPRSAGSLLGGLLTALLAVASPAVAQVNVTTLGGGPTGANPTSNSGFANGSLTLESQFNTPSAAAINSAGLLFIADTDNGLIRRLDIAGDQAYTHLEGLISPVDLAFDSDDNLYVVDAGDGSIREFDRFRNATPRVFNGLNSPTGLSLDSGGNIFFIEESGNVRRINTDDTIDLIATGLASPKGIVVLDSGNLAITVEHAVVVVDPFTGIVTPIAGSGEAGLVDGPSDISRLDSPEKIAKAGNNTVIVADRGNHRVRKITNDGVTETIYGVHPDNWFSNYPGWEDGSFEWAESRDPVGVTVAADGTIYTTEVFYHLIRGVTGADLSGPSGSGGNGEEVFVTPPTISPDSGYYPNGVDVLVTSPNASVFYTIDGTEPTTNSIPLNIVNNKGTIRWSEKLRDLTSLAVAAYIGTNRSDIVQGKASSIDSIGITRDVEAGIGSTAVVPVILNVRTNTQLKSLQFRVEVTPDTAGAEMVSDQLKALPSNPDTDFIVVATSDEDSADPAIFNAFQYTLDATRTRGLGIAFIGTEANYSASAFAVAALVAVPIPFSASVGDSYTIRVLEASGTADGEQSQVTLAPMPSRTITVTNPSYVVGDSSPGHWYNGGEFGDGNLTNADVNNAFAASLGIRLPYSFADVYDSMDVFPEDTPGVAGGDGEIRFLDWQLVLYRSLRLDINNWTRHWDINGYRVAEPLDQLGATTRTYSRLSGGSLKAAAADDWYREATFRAGSQGNVNDFATVELPVYVTIRPGATLSGLSFRAKVEPQGGAPALTTQVTFTKSPDLPSPGNVTTPGVSEVAVGWSLGSFVPPLEGEVLLGTVRVRVPGGARKGEQYIIRFPRADGAPDIRTQYEFESIPGSVNVESPVTVETLSDEWRRHFFGSLNDENGHPDIDADGDGHSNQAEFDAGTDPTDRESILALLAAKKREGDTDRFALRWKSARGRAYLIERKSGLDDATWETIAADIVGDGDELEFSDPNPAEETRFYRIRVQ